MRVTYLIESFSNTGGIERVISCKANWLVQNTDIEVSIVSYLQSNKDKDFFELDSDVNRVKLSCKGSDLKNTLSAWLKSNPQDICISTYGREFNILYKLKDKSRKIVEFHFCYDINKQWSHKYKLSLISQLFGTLKTIRMGLAATKYDKIVVLTQSDVIKWNNRKVTCIHNPLTIVPKAISNCSQKRIIALGRMDRQKGFDYLIDCWSLIENKYPDWRLDVFGSGDSTLYNRQISNMNLKNIEIHPATKDVCAEYINSSIYVLSSRYEGFSLTICEAMSCGLPIVTFDCPSGPAELVAHGKNGYIVDNVGDITQMSKYISDLIENEERRKEFGRNSYIMSKNYHIDSIMEKWVHLFEELLSSEK